MTNPIPKRSNDSQGFELAPKRNKPLENPIKQIVNEKVMKWRGCVSRPSTRTAAIIPTQSLPPVDSETQALAQQLLLANAEGESSEVAALTKQYTPVSKYVEHSLVVGEGGYGKVVTGNNRVTGSPVAIKKHAAHRKFYNVAVNESLILQELERRQVPHRLHLRDTYEELPRRGQKNQQRVIVTDLIPSPNLYENHLSHHAPLGKLKFSDVVTIARQFLEYLAHLRKAKIIHCDLKPSNVIFEVLCRQLTVLDHGISLKLDQDSSRVRQTSFYRSPEAILDGPTDCSVDIWSLGCILFELLTNSPLFPIYDHPDQIRISALAHLQKMAVQIGMPSLEFLQKCKDASIFFKLRLPVQFQQPFSSQVIFWDTAIQIAAIERGLSPEETAQFIELLRGMLKYENRVTPEELLTSPLFKNDISFHLSDDFSPQDIIMIYSESAIEAYLQNISVYRFPDPIFCLDKAERVTRSCYHLPRDPSDRYRVLLHRPGYTCPPQTFHLREGQTLSFIIGENQPAEITPPAPALNSPFPDALPTDLLENDLPSLFNLIEESSEAPGPSFHSL
ncbi:MAG TPA: protein kinase [Rhabdochlamydiaceae bacterium]